MENNDLIIKAKDLAISAHSGQKYGEYEYSKHLNDVVLSTALLAKMFNLDDYYKYGCVAWLHDTLEDTNITYDELLSEFGKEIADAVQAMTKPKDVSYWEYVASISDNKIATLVKFADAAVNYSECLKGKDLKRAEKYEGVINQLNKPFKQHFGEIRND